MGNYENLKAAIADVITTNGNNEITGAVLRQILQTTVSSIGENSTFGGVVTPETNVGTPDQNVFYVAKTPGVYQYMGGTTVKIGEIAFFTNKNNQWVAQTIVIADSFASFVDGSSFDVLAQDNRVEVEFNTADGEPGTFIIPSATTENAGVMSAEDKTSMEILKYPLFDLEVEKVNKRFYDSGYLASFIDVKLGFNYDGSKYFVYIGNGLIKNNTLNPNGNIQLYKDDSYLFSLRPTESSPNEARVFKSDDGFNTIVLDITKLDPAYDFALNVNSGVNLSSKCFGFTDTADIKSLESNVDALHQNVSENEPILFPYVIPSSLGGTETSSIQKYGLLSRQFIKELYIYDISKIQNEDITQVFVSLVARNNSTYGWLIWFCGTNKEGTNRQSFIQAKTGGKNFDESTEIIELVYNDANGGSPCGYIVVDWSFIEDGVNLNTVFKWNLTEHCLDIVYSPIIKSYIDDKNIKSSVDDTISEINENLDAINRGLNRTEETLVQDSIITQYVHPDGSLSDGKGNYGSYVYNIEGIFGMFKIKAGVSNNPYVSVCRVVDANGNRIVKYPIIITDINDTQFINIREEDNAKTLYVSVTMSNNVTTKPSVVVVENSNLINLENNVEDIQKELENLSAKIVVFDKKRITDNDKVVDSSIENPLKCYSTSANNFGTNNAYNYWYTLFKLPAYTKCVPFERKNTMSANEALVVKVDSLEQFKLNGSYTRLVAGGDIDTSSYGTAEVYQHKPIEFDEDTYIAVLSNSETDYTKFCYLEFWTATDVTLTDINDRVLELEGVGIEKPKPYEIVIPDKVYAVVGDTLQIFYDSVFNVQNLANYQVQALSDKGKAYPRYFEYNPTSTDVGETTLTFNLCEIVDCTTGVANILVSKEVSLITVPSLTNSISANVLCVGDSTTAGGVWCKELARRFYANDGNPQGLGLTTINICGRKTGIVANKTYGWEGTGGWTWSTYVSSPVDAVRFAVEDVDSLTMGANYVAPNGVIFEIVEINVTNGVGNIRCQYSWDTPNKDEIPASGTLTKRYSTTAGDDTITYTSYESEKFSPFYVNGEVDFIDYANKYCNGIINVIVIHLGINSMFGLKPNLDSHLTSIMNTAKIFIDKFHEQFPNSKVLLITPPKCSVIGGMAANYNATQTATEGIYNRQMFQYHKRYFELANQPEYKNWVTVVNTCGEFDTPYGYPYNEKDVDTRVSNIKERIGTNGVHPNSDGYNMIADSVYRTLNGIL
jgi:lysophospholipase L1-like esterase